ncbi:MAG TPA: tetratricopeptide repeat protein [Thermoanaerobaculia bacterium]|nr:tetratricopeptide repeat protein [Thermoanaerobaculia bacterium]
MSSSSAFKSCAIAIALIGATFVALWPVGANGFIGFDDPRYITRNEEVRAGLTSRGVVWAFTTTHAYNWHPLTWLSHMTDVELFGLDPAAHHRVSVALHAANAVLLFVLLRSSTGALWPSALVAFLFALHPLRVESVAWASERKDVLGASFWLLTMLLYVAWTRRPGTARFVSVVAAFAAGLMAKPMLVTLPFVLLLFDVWPLGRVQTEALPVKSKRKTSSAKAATASPQPWRSMPGRTGGAGHASPWRRLIVEKTPLLVLAAGASVMTLRAQQGIVQSVERFPLPARIANAAISCARYLGKMFWPQDLAVFYPYRELSLASPTALGAIALLLAITALAVRCRRRGYPIVGWLWFLGTLVPVLGLVQAGIQSMADRYTYLPGIGILIALVWAAAEQLERRGALDRAVARHALFATATVVLAVLGWLTWRQTMTWRDDETLFAHAASATRDSYWAHYNLGLTLLDGGRAGEAIPQFEDAVRLQPTSVEALVNLGRALEQSGRVPEAIAAFRRAREANREDLPAARHLSRLLVSSGGASEAETVAAIAASRWPDDSQLQYTTGIARLMLDRPGDALEPLRRAVAIDPAYAAAHNALGIALVRAGDRAAAIEHFQRAVEIEPDYLEARQNLARVGSAPTLSP